MRPGKPDAFVGPIRQPDDEYTLNATSSYPGNIGPLRKKPDALKRRDITCTTGEIVRGDQPLLYPTLRGAGMHLA